MNILIPGLRYSTDASPGITRKKRGKTFVYVTPRGTVLKQPGELSRIKSLVIPPAWTDVWICPHPKGHIQATGRDARGRKQYRYHPLWRLMRDRTKYDRLLKFSEVLPKLRIQIEKDLKKTGLPREKVLAAVLRLLDTTHMRVGNEEYARDNHSFGLTTLLDKHVHIHGDIVRLTFRGKSGQMQDVGVRDTRLARTIKRCEEMPGHELFQYITREGEAHDVHSDHVNEYIRDIAGDDFSAKDFRTWGGTIHAAIALYEGGEFSSETKAKQLILEAVRSTAKTLGNKPATCRKYYIDPRVISAFLDGSLQPLLQRFIGKKKGPAHSLHPQEQAVAILLRNTRIKK